jgi:hypothetical protein
MKVDGFKWNVKVFKWKNINYLLWNYLYVKYFSENKWKCINYNIIINILFKNSIFKNSIFMIFLQSFRYSLLELLQCN